MKKIIMAIASVSLLCACGTIFSSGKQELAFDSNIADTEIYINGQKICSTPCITNIERGNKKLLIKASKPDIPTARFLSTPDTTRCQWAIF